MECPACKSEYGTVHPTDARLYITAGPYRFAVLPLEDLKDIELVRCTKCKRLHTVREWRQKS